MKKNVILGAALLGAASFAMLSGFDSAETADSVMQKAQEASQAATQTTADFDAAADITVEKAGSSAVSLKGSVVMDIAAETDPLAAAVTGSLSGSITGTASDQDIAMDIASYVVTEGDDIKVYAGADDAWYVQDLEDSAAEQIQAMLADSSAIDTSDMPITFELSDEPLTLDDGTECYLLTTTLDWDALTELVNWAVEKSEAATAEVSEDETEDINGDAVSTLQTYMSIFGLVASDLQINVSYAVDTETYLPKYVLIDMDGSDWSNALLTQTIASVLGLADEDGSANDVTITVDELYMDILYDYEAEVDVTVPEDVKAQAQELEDSEEYLEALEG